MLVLVLVLALVLVRVVLVLVVSTKVSELNNSRGTAIFLFFCNKSVGSKTNRLRGDLIVFQ
jgi:hypothetical protein